MKFGLLVERTYPWCAGLIAGWLWYHFDLKLPKDEKEFLSAAVSVGAILAGFVAAALAILAALPNDSMMGRIRNSGYINELVPHLAQALYGCLAFSVLCLCAFFPMKDGSQLSVWWAASWVALGVFALFAFVRVASTLMKVLRLP